jgi:hypothetical protein
LINPEKNTMTQDLRIDDWGLSAAAVLLLSQEPEIVADLVRDRSLPPLPPGYVPRLVEVLFDDLPYIRWQDGSLIYVRDCRQDYQPMFVEYRFDGEMAVFQIQGEYVVNRIEGIAQAATLADLLN